MSRQLLAALSFVGWVKNFFCFFIGICQEHSFHCLCGVTMVCWYAFPLNPFSVFLLGVGKNNLFEIAFGFVTALKVSIANLLGSGANLRCPAAKKTHGAAPFFGAVPKSDALQPGLLIFCVC